MEQTEFGEREELTDEEIKHLRIDWGFIEAKAIENELKHRRKLGLTKEDEETDKKTADEAIIPKKE